MPPRTRQMSLNRWLLGSIPVTMALMVILPYTLLRDLNAWYGSALLWVAATVLVIMIAAIYTRHWKD